MAFVDAYHKPTGRKLPMPVPEFWIDHPILGRDLSLLPSAKSAPAKSKRRPKRSATPALPPLPVQTTTDTPADGDNKKE